MKYGVNKHKKFVSIFLCFLIFLSCFFCRYNIGTGFVVNVVYAEEESDVEQELEQEVSNQLNSIDFDEVEKILLQLSSETKNLFSSNSFRNTVESVISGEYVINSSNFFSGVGGLFWNDIKKYVPLVASIIAIAILGGMIEALKPATTGKSIGNIVNFVTYGFVIVILGSAMFEVINTVKSSLGTIKSIFDAIFPILMTILTALGGSVSVGLYQPAVALLSNLIICLMTYILLPIFVFSVVFSIVGNLSNNLKLDKFVSFLQGMFKWTIGLCFTIFLGFLSIQGLVANTVDGLSIKTAKYALKSYVPIVGGYISDGFSVILASGTLIKNAIGGVGLLLLMSTVVVPILSTVVFMLSLRFVAGVIEPIGDKKIANFVSEISKSLSMLVALLVAVSFMYMVVTGLVMFSANLVS